jgi:hypothetical protein
MTTMWVALPSAGRVGETVLLNILVQVEILQYYLRLAAEKARNFVQVTATAVSPGITTPSNRLICCNGILIHLLRSYFSYQHFLN